MVASLAEVRGKSGLHRAGCLVKTREVGVSPSTVQSGTVVRRRESNSDEGRPARPGGVKRAILPVAISDAADQDGGSPRLEVESSHEGDDVTGGASAPRER